MTDYSPGRTTKPVVKSVSYFLSHVPSMICHGSKPSREITKDPALFEQVVKHLNPFPANLGEIIEKYDSILVPEMNLGQLRIILQSKFLKPIQGLNKVQGQPFKTSDVALKIDEILSGKEIVK